LSTFFTDYLSDACRAELATPGNAGSAWSEFARTIAPHRDENTKRAVVALASKIDERLLPQCSFDGDIYFARTASAPPPRTLESRNWPLQSTCTGRAQRQPYLLSGLLRCGVCGGSMTVVGRKAKAGVSYARLGCTAHSSRGSAILSECALDLGAEGLGGAD
jgi:hypothetical protein